MWMKEKEGKKVIWTDLENVDVIENFLFLTSPLYTSKYQNKNLLVQICDWCCHFPLTILKLIY
jgi:hypothetical protein